MIIRSLLNQSIPSIIQRRHFYTNKLYSRPTKDETTEFIFSSIKVIVISSVIWGFESNRKYQRHHLEVNDRILSTYTDCLKRHNTKERCQREKKFLEYIFKPDY